MSVLKEKHAIKEWDMKYEWKLIRKVDVACWAKEESYSLVEYFILTIWSKQA